MTPSPRSAPRRNRNALGAGRVSQELPQPPTKGEPKWREDGFDGKFEVVYSRVAFRSAASTKATLLHVAKQGTIVSGTVEVSEGNAWLKLSEPWFSEVTQTSSLAWVLIHGACVGLGDLLRPLHEKSESVEALLKRLAGEHTERVQPVIAAVKEAGFLTGSQLLAGTETAEDREKLMARITEYAVDAGIDVPDQIVSCLRAFIEDSRLAFSGFPYSPPNTKNRILFTAPHSLPLVRPGHRPHLPEKLTSHLAREFANIVGGAYLTWTQREDARALEYFRCEGVPDITNRDPNFTPRDALSESPWTRNLNEVKALWGPHRPCLHVDLHGCKDPGSDNGSHLVIGLRAMEFASRAGFAEALRHSLLRTLAVALRGLSVNVRPQKQLTGALEDNCCTLTQQSMSLDGGSWTCSVQMEMSRSLRKRLTMDKELKTLMAQSIWFAWVLTSRDVVDPPAFTHSLGYWVARCKALYSKKPTLELIDAGTNGSNGTNGIKAEKKPLKKESAEASPGGAADAPAGEAPAGDAPAGEAPAGEAPGAEAETSKDQGEVEDDEVIDVEGEEEDEEASEANAAEEENAAAETAGGATANSEPRAPPFEGNIEELAESFIKFSKMLEGTDAPPAKMPLTAMLENRPTRVQLFRDWLRSPYEYETVSKLALEPPLTSFSLAGSWNDFQPQDMKWDGNRFVHDIKIGAGGREHFQIWKRGDGKVAYYPSQNNAGPFTRHQMRGPDANGHGKNWLIGRPGCEASPGDHFRVALILDGEENAVEVVWMLIKAGPKAEKPWAEEVRNAREESRKKKEEAEKYEEEARRLKEAEKYEEEARKIRGKHLQAQAIEATKKAEQRRIRAWEEEEAVREADRLRDELDAKEREEAERFLENLFNDAPSDANGHPVASQADEVLLGFEEEECPSTKSAGRGLLDVLIFIDRELGLFMHERVELGTTVQALKRQLAESDLTGGTLAESIQLSLGSNADPLDDADLITADHAELDICTPEVT